MSTVVEAHPGVGVHYGLPAREYHAIDAVSNSRLSLLKRSPAHLRTLLDQPKPSTDAQELGTALHFAVLEPELFEDRYKVAGQCEATTSKGSRCTNTGSVHRAGHWFCRTRGHDPEPDAEPEPCDALSTADYFACIAARDAALAHPKAKEVLSGGPARELTLVWEDEDTGLLCKARIDHLNPRLDATVEVKTTRNVEPRDFARDAFRYGYHRQGAWYHRAVRQFPREFFPATRHLIVAVELSRPFAVNVYEHTGPALDAGRYELRRLLERYAECVREDHWPLEGKDYSPDVLELTLPDYAWADIESED